MRETLNHPASATLRRTTSGTFRRTVSGTLGEVSLAPSRAAPLVPPGPAGLAAAVGLLLAVAIATNPFDCHIHR